MARLVDPVTESIEDSMVLYRVLDTFPVGLFISEVKDNTVQLWDVVTGTAVQPVLSGHSDIVLAIVFSPNSQLVASGSADNTIRLRDVKTGECMSNLLLNKCRTNCSLTHRHRAWVQIKKVLNLMFRLRIL